MKVLVIGKGVTAHSIKEVLGDHNCDKLIMPYEKKEKGEYYYEEVNFTKYDFIIKTSGYRDSDYPVNRLKSANVKFISEVDFTYLNLNYSPLIIAVSGSNGKTTTTLLIKHILDKKGISNILVGNNDTPFIKALKTKVQVIIIELSSFQLLDLKYFHPNIAIITSLSENHLDFHKSFENYLDSKKKISLKQTKDDYFIIKRKIMKKYQFSSKAKIIYPASIFKLPNLNFKHNKDNLKIVKSVFKILKIKISLKDFLDFKFPLHRLTYLGRVGKCKIYDDSKSTSVEATLKAYKSLGKGGIIFLGGKSKNCDEAKLLKLKAKLIVYGNNEVLKNVYHYPSLKEAFSSNYLSFKKYKYVLFSPAFSSLDQYKSYKERGEEFISLVREYLNVEK